IADECHEFKGKSSDRGIAFHQLVTACQATITLTGTFFGGKSTSIFWRTPVTGHLFQWR
ncbi:MAG: hypothetical protein GX433_16745, partial [Deltaproteobacteria bacterium]|nr:hypothetical protein [Deltaproteobacteria bacterium]